MSSATPRERPWTRPEQAAARRGELSASTPSVHPASRLLIRDPCLATWLIADGRARRAGRDQAVLVLTPAHLLGLSVVDFHDAVVLDAYLTAFVHTVAQAGYRMEAL